MQSLSNILAAFTTVQHNLTEFITAQTQTNNNNRELLRTGEQDVAKANKSLKLVNKLVGK